MNNTSKVKKGILIPAYAPSELMEMFNSGLSTLPIGEQVVFIEGKYKSTGSQPCNGEYYDTIEGENGYKLTVQVTESQRENLSEGDTLRFGGTLSGRLNKEGMIQLILKVSRIDEVRNYHADKTMAQQVNQLHRKIAKGSHNIDSLLEGLLISKRLPKVAVMIAEYLNTTSNLLHDLNAAAQNQISFSEIPVNFSSSIALTWTLKKLETQNYDLITIVSEDSTELGALDSTYFLEAVVNCKLPTLCAVGHGEEKLFLRSLVDKIISTPAELCTYFSEIVQLAHQ